jgi:hypothetical protein
MASSARPRSQNCWLAAMRLRRSPAGVQDLCFARLYLMKRVVIGVLSLFWMTSGLVALARFDAASGILAGSLPALSLPC